MSIVSLDYPPIVLMSGSYARRAAAAGLFLQGVFEENMYLHALNIFKKEQLITAAKLNFKNYEETINFQEEAAAIAWEFMSTYDSRLEKNIILQMVGLVEHYRDKVIRLPNYEDVITNLLRTYASMQAKK